MNNVNLTEPLSFPMTDTDAAFTAQSTYKIFVTYGKFVKAIHFVVALLNTGVGVNRMHTALIRPEWKNGVEKEKPPRPRTATKQPLQIELLNMSFLHLKDLFARVLVWHRTTTCREYATRQHPHIPLHSQNFSISKKHTTVALATSSNPDQPEIRLQSQQRSGHSRIFHAN